MIIAAPTIPGIQNVVIVNIDILNKTNEFILSMGDQNHSGHAVGDNISFDGKIAKALLPEPCWQRLQIHFDNIINKTIDFNRHSAVKDIVNIVVARCIIIPIQANTIARNRQIVLPNNLRTSAYKSDFTILNNNILLITTGNAHHIIVFDT